MVAPDGAWRERAVVCVDFGSTFTKAVAGRPHDRRAARHREPPDHAPGRPGAGDVLDGYDACLAALAEQDARAADAEVLACSSAGGGLRIAVVGNEELVTAEAGRRVALSSGGKVVAVLHGGLDDDQLADAPAAEPDVVLLVGGTDGGNAEVLEGDARFLAGRPLAGARSWSPATSRRSPRSRQLLDGSGTPYVLADNVVPRIGVLAPDSARRRDPRDVPGARHRRQAPQQPHRRPRPHLHRDGAGRDARRRAHRRRAARPRPRRRSSRGAGDVVVVDVGGATTDVHSVVELDPEDSGLAREVVATDAGHPHGRGRPRHALVGGLARSRPPAATTSHAAAVRRREQPDLLPDDCPDPAAERDVDDIAAAAVRLALERHAGRSKVVVSPEGRVVERTGKDLREVDLLVGSGGVLRHGADGVVRRVLAARHGRRLRGRAGSCRATRASSSTTTTCWPPPGCWPSEHPVAAHRLVQWSQGAQRDG